MIRWWGRRQERRNDEWWKEYKAQHRWDELFTYNAEVKRGIVHTPKWDRKMAAQQALFDEEQAAERSRRA